MIPKVVAESQQGHNYFRANLNKWKHTIARKNPGLCIKGSAEKMMQRLFANKMMKFP
jgi:hypothetical protein